MTHISSDLEITEAVAFAWAATPAPGPPRLRHLLGFILFVVAHASFPWLIVRLLAR